LDSSTALEVALRSIKESPNKGRRGLCL
jgi:hypothetical protein